MMDNETISLEDASDNQHVLFHSQENSNHTRDFKINSRRSSRVLLFGLYSIVHSPIRWNICGWILFIIISIIIGVLVVCLTFHAENPSCHITMIQVTENSNVNDSRPLSLAVGYLNNDSWLDIVVINSGTNNIGIFLGYGNGSFSIPTMYSTGIMSHPISVAVGDMNDDHRVDIVFANYDSHTIGILFGEDDGAFGNPVEVLTGPSRPVSIAIGHLNGDRWLDIVIANDGTQSISILFGSEDGLFQTRKRYSTGYDSSPCSVAIGDLNNDHQLDIAVANYGTDSIGIFLGRKNGILSSQIILSTYLQSGPRSIALSDVNNDDRLDIIVANYHADNVGIFLGYGNGKFSSQSAYFLGSESNPCSVTADYIDSDNQLDIVVSNEGTETVSVLLGYGNGTFATPTTHSLPVGSSPMGLVVGDFDNNNQSDVAVSNSGINNIIILIEYSTISSENPPSYSVGNGSTPVALAMADLNNDSYLDIAVASYGTNSISILLGYGNGSFREQTSFNTGDASRPYQLTIGDINNDDFPDIVVANFNTDYMSILLGYGNGSFVLIKPYFYEQILSITSVAVGDFNDDYQLDIAQTDFGRNLIMIYLGYGNGSFVYFGSYTTGDGSRPISILVADFNNDRCLDIGITNFGTNSLGIFLGYGNGTFTEQTIYTTGDGSLPQRMVGEYINNDDCFDIAVGNSGTNNVGIFIGYCNGTFAAQLIYSTGAASVPYSVAIHDMNNDQWPDLIVSNQGLNTIGISFGYGNGSFSSPFTFSSGPSSVPYTVAVGDLNNDHRMDIASANHGTNNVGILLGHPNTGMNNKNVFMLGDYYSDFQNETVYSTGSSSRPYSIAVGDFNNDTKLDLVVANSGTENLGILLGDGNGHFMSEITYSLGTNSRPEYVIVNDFNKDNQLDLAVTDFLGNNVNVFLGYGNGSFAEPLIIPTDSGSNPISIASGDLNNDNWLDLVIINSATNTIDLMFGFQYASFPNPILSSTNTNVGFNSVAVGDLNNDGQCDVVIANYNTDNVGVFLGYGNGSFTPMMTYANLSGSHPWQAIVGDFNNDNKLDITVTVWGLNQMGVILGNGDGTFGEPRLYDAGIGARPVGITAGDFNNDHHLDIATANYGTGSVSVFLGHGDGTFMNAIIFSTEDGSGPSSITVADLDKDNHLDIIIANEITYNVGVLYGNGDGTFINVTKYMSEPNTSPQYALSGDFNNDHLPDIAVALYGSGGIGVFLSYGNRTFSPISIYSGGFDTGPQFLAVSDFNDDTHIDIVVGNMDDGSVRILFGNGDGTFKSIVSYYDNSKAAIYSVAVADFNNDMILDIVFIDDNENLIGVLFRNGFMPFGGHTSLAYVNGSNPSSVVLGHFNHDTNLDIVIANSGTNDVGVLLGNGDGTFEDVKLYSTGNNSQPLSIASGDFNNDTFLDIVIANSNTDNIGIYFGSHHNTFKHLRSYFTGIASYPVYVTVIDFNSDNISDIVVVNTGSSSIGIFIGYGNGSFATQILFPIGYNSHPKSIAFGNFNNDSWVDIALANYDAGSINILLNCPPT